MRNSKTYTYTIPLCVGLLLLQAVIAQGKTQQPLYKEYRGVQLGMTATETRAKLGQPVFMSDEQDVYVFSANETAQIAYDAAHKVVTISTDYTGGFGAPDVKAVVGEGALLQRPDGSLFRLMQYDAEHLWVSYNKSAGAVSVVTITLQVLK